MTSAYRLLREGQYAEAVDLYEAAIATKPDDLYSYWYLGLAYLLQGNDETAHVTWLATIAQLHEDQQLHATTNLIELLQSEAGEQKAKGNFEVMRRICRHLQELAFQINHLLEIARLLVVENGESDASLLLNLGLIEHLEAGNVSNLDTVLLLTTLQEMLHSLPFDCNLNRFVQASTAYLPNPQTCFPELLRAAANFTLNKYQSQIREIVAQQLTALAENHQIIQLDYAISPRPRYGYGNSPHPELYNLINRNRNVYQNYLQQFLRYKDFLTKIPQTGNDAIDPAQPIWNNAWLPGLDAIALYAFLCLNQPQRYFEVGSGNSTKFACQAIRDHNLRTTITSFDPYPRSKIDELCDRVIRQPFELCDLTVLEELEAGDILFVDHSHRVFMNSDATVTFLEVIPRLKPGILLQIHDIFLPYDYPPSWNQRFYAEQYVLAAYLLAEYSRLEIILPNAFISEDPELNQILTPLWEDPAMQGVSTHGGSFWLRIKP